MKSPATQPQKILLISPVATHPTISGNAIRPIYLAKELERLGYLPSFAFTDYGTGPSREMAEYWGRERFHYFPFRRGQPQFELKRIIRRLGLANSPVSHWFRSRRSGPADPARVRPPVDDCFDDGMIPWLSALHARHQYDAVVVHFVIMSKALSAFPAGIPKIIDTQEVFAVGREEEAARGAKYWVDITPEQEIAALRRADYVWTSQQHEEKVLRPFLGDKVMTVGHFIDPLPQVAEQSLDSKNILFVGGNHPANAEALRWFGREVYPRLQSWLPAKNVVVVGKVKNAVAGELPFNFLGQVQNLEPVYADARLAICPVLSGTGLKSKNVEAFAFSKPVVTTAFGRLGMEDADGRAHVVADTPVAFAEAIRELMTDAEHCRRMMLEALNYAREWNARLAEPMLRCFNSSSSSKI